MDIHTVSVCADPLINFLVHDPQRSVFTSVIYLINSHFYDSITFKSLHSTSVSYAIICERVRVSCAYKQPTYVHLCNDKKRIDFIASYRNNLTLRYYE